MKKLKSTVYQIDNPAGSYFLTFQLIDWVDVFTRKIYRDIILESLDYCRINKGLEVWAYVIMRNYVHCMLSANEKVRLIR